MITPAKLTSKGQVTIPKEIRDFLLLKTGGVVVFEKEKDHVVIRPHKTLKAFRGILKGQGQKASLDEIRHTVKTAVGKKVVEGKK
jgi:AbrB family looped-hinge helix DNA binding protein